MRHKHETRALLLARSHIGEANTLLTLLTSDIGLVYVRAQGLRKSGAKLAGALTTFSESEVVLVRGKESWRLAGAIFKEGWFERLRRSGSLRRASRVTRLLLRLVAGESRDTKLFQLMKDFFNALATLPKDTHEAVEILAVLKMLEILGLAVEVKNISIGEEVSFTQTNLDEICEMREQYIARINTGISASGL